jgi:hypothetical protein
MKTFEFPIIPVSFQGIPDYNQGKPWSPLHAWALNNEPSDEMNFKKAFWDQIFAVRNTLAEMFKDRLKEIRVVSTHTSKSIKLPVYLVTLVDGSFFIMRDNFHDWKVTVCSRTPVILNTAVLRCNEQINPIYCEGFEEQWVLGPYAKSNTMFTIEVYNTEQMLRMMSDIAHPNPIIATLASALERTSNRLRSVLESKTVRDADETLEEARHLLGQFKA